MNLSSRVFLVSADDMLHALASAAFMRMLRQEEHARVPDFAGQRVRQVSTVVELVDGAPTRTVYRTFSVLDFNADGLLDVVRLNNQQIARIEAGVWASRAGNRRDRGLWSTLSTGLLPEAARGSPTSTCCGRSRQPRWDSCDARVFEWLDEPAATGSFCDRSAN